MERVDWLDGGFDSAEARFLMVTAITHHRFNSAVWGEHEVRKLYAELAEIEASGARVLAALRTRTPGSQPGQHG
jgi:isocitrate dehydrogenase kinase/phosphatase